MKKLIYTACGVSLLFFAQAVFACEYPSRASIPSGATATKEEMIAGQRAVKTYVGEMEAYLECIVDAEKMVSADLDDLEPEVEQQREEIVNKKYNAAVNEMEMIAAQFNSEVQAYKARND